MVISLRYKELKKRLVELRKNFLPSKFSPIGQYNEKQIDRTKGYRLLVHAEFESYLEDRAQEIVAIAFNEWNVNSKPSKTIIGLLSFIEGTNPKEYSITIHARIHNAVTQFHRHLHKNNGIRQDNVFGLLLPIGINLIDIDTAWLSTIDSFGIKRGEIAHTTARTHQQIDPKTEYDTVNLIFTGLKNIDLKINELIT